MDASDLMSADPLRVLVDAAGQSKSLFDQCLKWLCLFVRSGVDITVPIFMQFASLIRHYDASFEQCSTLIKAALWSAWLKSMGRQDLQALISSIHSHVEQEVIKRLRLRTEIPAT